jgi:hypothetical protein
LSVNGGCGERIGTVNLTSILSRNQVETASQEKKSHTKESRGARSEERSELRRVEVSEARQRPARQRLRELATQLQLLDREVRLLNLLTTNVIYYLVSCIT